MKGCFEKFQKNSVQQQTIIKAEFGEDHSYKLEGWQHN